MKRISKSPSLQTNQISLEGSLLNRGMLASLLGFQYDGERDLYRALGYPSGEIKFSEFYSRYTRQDIAKAVIDRPVRATWQGALELVEMEEQEDTVFETAWAELDRKMKFKTKLARLDRLTGLGRYGVLLLGLDDVTSREAFAKPVKDGQRKLHYVKPYSESSAAILELETNPTNPRYGLPLYYTMSVKEANGGTTDVKVHYSRVIHVTDDPLESEVYGTPRLEGIYNRLMDIEKLVGGDAEMFWRGARPGYEGKVADDYTLTKEMREDLLQQINEYENNLRRFLINEGIDIQALQQQIASPKEHFEVQIACLSAVTGIPQRVLMGSERGELASSQDSSEWKEYVQARREDHAEPNIVRPLIDILIQYGILPAPVTGNYSIKWNDLYSLSEKARVDIGKSRATAIREYTYTPMAETILPPDAFFAFCLGLNTEQINYITKLRDEIINKEELYDKIVESLEGPEPAPMPAAAGKPAPAKPKPVKK